MITIHDNVFSSEKFAALQQFVTDNNFQTINVGGKDFTVLNPTEEIANLFLAKLQFLEGCKVEMILNFFRLATEELDTDWRIHSDLNINGQKPERAAVFYFNENKNGLFGTAFWEHIDYGRSLPINFPDDQYDQLLAKDANDLEKWRMVDVVSSIPNRLLSYDAKNFHSKFPNVGWGKDQLNGRVVFVMFYNLISE